jgi:hypothetical protein
MRCKPPDKRFYQELTELNAGFLSLFTDQRLLWHGPLLGLDPPITHGLRALAAAELDFVAATPCLLAGFPVLPFPDAVSESQTGARPADDRWLESARLYSAELTMYLWQLARQDHFATTLCVGRATDGMKQLTNMGFREMQASARIAMYHLRARFGRHPRFWPDLIRAARSGNQDLRSLSRLTIIPLTLAERRVGLLD